MLDVPIANEAVLHVFADGERRYSLQPPHGGWPDGAEPGMAVWSTHGDVLYYRANGDIWRWTEATGPRRFLEAVAWRHPTFSPDGRYLAYSVQRPDGLRNVYLMDLNAGTAPRLIGRKRTEPVFLNNAQLWYLSQLNAGCIVYGEPQRLIYDIRDGSEASSIISRPIAVWPATSSNY